MANHGTDYNNPMFRYSIKEIQNMSDEEFGKLLDEHSEYLTKKYRTTLNEQKRPEFKNLQEIMDYYEAIPFDEAMNNLDKLFVENM
jgi:hypothetical protein